MSTQLPSGAVMWGRILGLAIILSSTIHVGFARGQGVGDVNVEWLNFEQHGRQFLVLNAYEPADPRAEINPLFLEIPLRKSPTSPAADAFLDALEYVAVPSPMAGTWKPETVAEWTHILTKLTTRDELWIYGRNIVSSEIPDILKVVYASQGYPSREDPVFPHLTRGVLAALDSDGKALTSIDVNFADSRSGAPLYKVVSFVNVGSEPVQVYESSTLLDGYLSGAEFTLGPNEEIRRLLRFESPVFSVNRGLSNASIKYVSEDRHFNAVELTGRHAGLFQGFSGTLVSAAGLRTGSWDDMAGYPIALAFGGALLVLLLVVSLTFAPEIIARLPHPRPARPPHERPIRQLWDQLSDALAPRSIQAALRSALDAFSHLKAERIKPAMVRSAQKARQRISSIEGIRVYRRKRRRQTEHGHDGTPEFGNPDSDTPDSPTPDYGTPDYETPPPDTRDSNTRDSNTQDSNTQDSNTHDSGHPDFNTPDAPTPHGQWPDLPRPLNRWTGTPTPNNLWMDTPTSDSQWPDTLSPVGQTSDSSDPEFPQPQDPQPQDPQPQDPQPHDSRPQDSQAIESAAIESAALASLSVESAGVVSISVESAGVESLSVESASAHPAALAQDVALEDTAGAAALSDGKSRLTEISGQAAAIVVSCTDRIRGSISGRLRRTRPAAAALGGALPSPGEVLQHIHAALASILGSIYQRRPSFSGVRQRVDALGAHLQRIPPYVYGSARSTRARVTSFWNTSVVPLRQTIKRSLSQFLVDSRKKASIWKAQAEQLAINVYLYREFHSTPLTPKDAVECIERLRQISHELDSSALSSAAASQRIRSEATCLARRLGSDLDHELLPPTTTNFQTLWALRMLVNLLATPPADVREVLHSWLLGADHVLSHEGREGIGPTIPAFLKLMQPGR